MGEKLPNLKQLRQALLMANTKIADVASAVADAIEEANTKVEFAIGDINALLDAINGEVV